MSSSFGTPASQEIRGNGLSIRCLDGAIVDSRIPRKVLADNAGIGEAQFSKLVHHPALDLLDTLPDDLLTDFIERVGRERGTFIVKRVTVADIDEKLLRLVATVESLLRLKRLKHVRTKTVKADLRGDTRTAVSA